MQAEGRSSDCVLKPVAVYPDSGRTNGVLVKVEGKTKKATLKLEKLIDCSIG
jgi:glutamine synthetase